MWGIQVKKFEQSVAGGKFYRLRCLIRDGIILFYYKKGEPPVEKKIDIDYRKCSRWKDKNWENFLRSHVVPRFGKGIFYIHEFSGRGKGVGGNHIFYQGQIN